MDFIYSLREAAPTCQSEKGRLTSIKSDSLGLHISHSGSSFTNLLLSFIGRPCWNTWSYGNWFIDRMYWQSYKAGRKVNVKFNLWYTTALEKFLFLSIFPPSYCCYANVHTCWSQWSVYISSGNFCGKFTGMYFL